MTSIHLLATSDLITEDLEPGETVSAVREALIDRHERPKDCPRKLMVTSDTGASFAMLGRSASRQIVGFKTSFTHHEGTPNATKHYATTLTLHDDNTGQPIAIMDAGPIGAIRTPAVTALLTAVSVSRPPHRVAVIGSGTQAQHALGPLLDVWDSLNQATFMGSHPHSLTTCLRSARLAANARKRAVDIETHLGIDSEVIAQADLVLGVAGPKSPLQISSQNLKKGATAVTVGYGIGPHVCHDASFVITTSREQMEITGRDYADETGNIRRADFELSELLSNGSSVPRSNDDIVFCYNSGLVVTDIAVGELLARKAITGGKGMVINLWDQS